MSWWRFLLGGPACWLAGGVVAGQVVINEVHYHPVEKPSFDAAGDPVLDLSGDVHEFIELKNVGATPVSLAGWRLAGGVEFVFPSGAMLAGGGHLVVAKSPRRLEAVTGYGLAAGSVWGPWGGGLSNDGETIRLETVAGGVEDAVTYSSAMPWPVAANSLGAESEWTGVDEMAHQYRGRSLERVSASWASNDPANWVASPLTAGPSPGRANGQTWTVPRPVVSRLRVVQQQTGSEVIRAQEPVVVEAHFSPGGSAVSGVQVEYFVDDINVMDEPRLAVGMDGVAGRPGVFRAVVPGQADRRVVRYRIVADRGTGVETVSPREDDPYGWHAWFVAPVRSGELPKYDLFISSASVSTLASNIAGNPRRIVTPDPPGMPRDSWNATEPAVLVRDGRVIDVRVRHHGSRYNRNALRVSLKVQFPRYARLDGVEAFFFKDKGDEHRVGAQLYRAAGLPAFDSRFIQVFINNGAVRQRLEVPEMDERHFEKFALEQAARFPGAAVEPTGEFYKATGVVPYETGSGLGSTSDYAASGEGPYFIGNGAPIPAKPGWTQRQRYEFTYGPQMHPWIGGRDVEAMVTGLWSARGDTPTSPNPNLGTLRAWLEAHFDVDATLTSIAIRNWCAPFDNATHNYFLWRRANGRWAMLPWDLDGELGNTTQTIYWDEQTTPQPDSLRGPQWIKDSFLKCFRDEYRQRLWILNHTILDPSRFGPAGYDGAQSFAVARQANVDTQLGLGPFYRPATPRLVAPSTGASVLPGAVLRTAAYAHGAPGAAPVHAATTWMIRAAGGSWEAPVFRRTSEGDLEALPIPFEALVFGATYHWKVVHTDADGHPSMESEEGSFVFGSPPPDVPALRLNEVFARGAGADFIELHNAGAVDAELGGVGLTDAPEKPPALVFPSGSVLPAGGYRVITLDASAPFRLDGDGQALVLVRPDGTLLDTVAFGPQAADRSIGRGLSGWSVGPPTPGSANLPEPAGASSLLRINEWMASNPDGPDWFELVNTGPDVVNLAGLTLGNGSSRTVLPALSFIGPGGFQRWVADRSPGPSHVDFRLSSSGETIVLAEAEGTVIDTVVFGPQQSGISEGRLPDGGLSIVRFPGHATPGEPNALAIEDVVISRIFPDIELYNRSDRPVVVDGWRLSDDLGDLGQWVIPGGFGAVPSGGKRVVLSDMLPFALDRLRGGAVYLTHDGTHRSRRDYGAWDGNPWGLVKRDAGDVFIPVRPWPTTPVNVPVVGPVVISEIHYHPLNPPGDEASSEFVEWHNISALPVDVSDWRLDGEVSLMLPAGTVLVPGGRLVCTALAVEEFIRRFAVAPGTRVIGPWAGSLSNGGGRLRLVRRLPAVSDPGPDFGYRPEQVLEEIEYDDAGLWPAAADGGGDSLVRLHPAGFGADAVQWTTGAPSPGSEPSLNQAPTLSLEAPLEGATIPAGSPIEVRVVAADADGRVMRVVLEADGGLVAVDEEAPFHFLWSSPVAGPHTLRVTAIDDRLALGTASVSLTLTSAPPRVALRAPAARARLAAGEVVMLDAAAEDPEGRMDRVDFLVDGAVVGSATSAPWRLAWTAGPAGHRLLQARASDATGLSGLSSSVAVFVAGEGAVDPTIAYWVPSGTVGSQSYGGSLGHDFDVLLPILVTRLGVFDSGADGLSGPLTAQIWDNQAPVRSLASLSFTAASPGELAPGTSSRFKPLPTPLVLPAGSYSAVAFGYGPNELNGNAGSGPRSWLTQSGGGMIRFTGTSRYGSAGEFPATPDGGPVDRYAGPTFEFAPADGDGDFMPLDWELLHGLDPQDPADGPADADGDGVANHEEYAAGTDPRDPLSRPLLTLVQATSEATVVRFLLPAHRSAVLQSSGDLLFWVDRATAPGTATARTVEFSVPLATAEYLRVAIRP